MTNFELAQTMARLGVVTASALDAGGSSTMAFGGELLSRPSDSGGERLVSEALLVMYYGVYAPATELSFSPNGDGAGDRQRLEYKIVKPSTVTATLTGPDGVARTIDSGERKADLYQFAFAGGTRSRPALPSPGPLPLVDRRGRRGTPPDRRAPRSASTTRLGFISVQPSRMTVGRKRGGRLLIGFTLTRPARVTCDHIQDGPAPPRREELQRARRQDRRPVERQVPERQAGLLAPTSPGSWRRTGSGGPSLPAPSG